MDDRNAPLSFCRSGMTLVSILERGATEDNGNGAGAIRADDDFAVDIDNVVDDDNDNADDNG